ncbi:MAG TPA: hypothetical protein VE621_15920 [Bryobacteraceae bacterium]|nr:hypothetical protein [Bryobacteraceae bacterium]
MSSRLGRLCVALAAALWGQNNLGWFEGHGDIGTNPKPGSAVYEAAAGQYRITGGGANIWGTQDAFHFVWRRVSGDATLSADIAFEAQGADPHRKAVLMVRQDLTPGSVYADIAVHGDGLTSLQYRTAAGGPTAEMRSEVKAPTRVRLERRGNRISVFAGNRSEEFKATGPQVMTFTDPVYVGIGVSSHNADVVETAVFKNVQVQVAPHYLSKIRIFDLEKKTNQIVYSGDGIIEAPNWSRDGKWLLVNSGGSLFRLPLGTASAQLEKIELQGGPYRCNNDHDLSFDGRRLAFSASSPNSRASQVYVANADGTDVRLATPAAPSYFHGWSPDGKWLAFVGQRNGKFELYRVPADGGPEQQLTSAGAYDDGPEYSPDGKWIYFNSNRGGGWNIWRMPPNGAGPGDKLAEQITNDAGEDWFPHLSPNGRHMAFLSFPAGTAGHNDRMPGMLLRMLPASSGRVKLGAEPTVLVTFFGGQGSINVNSWSPDSKRFAFVEYELVEETAK